MHALCDAPKNITQFQQFVGSRYSTVFSYFYNYSIIIITQY